MMPLLNKTLGMFDPVPVGLYEYGEIAFQTIATPQGPKHCIIQGMTGAGKTEGEKGVILTCAKRGAVQIIVDVRKKTQSYGMLAPVLDWLIVDDGVARAALTRLIERVIPARTEHLAAEGFPSWTPKSSLKFMRFQVEEAWDFVDADELVKISLAARSAGIQLIISLQRASHDMMSTTLRDQLGTVKCYGLKGAWGSSILDDEVEDAGARPQKWADESPGMLYLQQGGLTLEQKATPVRAYTDINGSVKFADVAIQLGRQTSECDATTASAWGDLYFRRTRPLDLILNVGTITVTKQTIEAIEITSEPEIPDSADDDEVGDNGMELVEDATATLDEDGKTLRFSGSGRGDKLVFSDPDPQPGYVPDPDELIEDRDADRDPIRMGDGRPKAAREDFDAAMEVRLQVLVEGGADIIRAADFVDVIVSTKWSRGSVYGVFETWVQQNLVVRSADGWVPVRG